MAESDMIIINAVNVNYNCLENNLFFVTGYTAA